MRRIAPSVELKHSRMFLRVRPGTHDQKKQAIVEEWYRDQLKKAVPPLIAKWEPLMGVTVGAVLRSAHENQMGKLQPQQRHHPP